MNLPHDSAAPSFHTTHWSLVLLAAGREGRGADDALEALCREYWPPLYSFIRRRGETVAEAQDLTQEFFARLLAKNYLQAADRERGRFRAFLIGSLKHFLANERKAARAQKRGGGKQVFSLDFEAAEAKYLAEPVDERTPEQIYEQQWAVLLIERVLQRVEQEFTSSGKGDQFQKLRYVLVVGPDTPGYAAIAADLQTTEAAVKMAVHRLRKRYRELLREEIGQTVADEAEIEGELKELFAALAS
jgi:DNA-directed RNA polymerase specialized sigma24 family protein